MTCLSFFISDCLTLVTRLLLHVENKTMARVFLITLNTMVCTPVIVQ